MRSTTPFAFFVPCALAGLLVTSAPPAVAAPDAGLPDAGNGSCTEDSQCGHGFACQVVAIAGCTAPACAPDQPGCDAGAQTPCTPKEERACRPGACVTDGDCGADMTCIEHDEGSCSSAPAATPCPAGQKCESTPPECTTVKVKACTYAWTLPCQTAADCGSGPFTCEAAKTRMCSGGTSVSRDDAGNVVPGDVYENCTTVPLDFKSCTYPSTACTTASECPSGWSCEPPGVAPCLTSSDGTSMCPDASTMGSCAPPGYATARGSSKDGSFGGAPQDSADAAVTPVASPALDGGAGSSRGSDDATGADRGSGSATMGGGGTTTTTTGSGSGGGASGGDGCNAGAGAVGEGGWLAMLGVAEVLRRIARRRR